MKMAFDVKEVRRAFPALTASDAHAAPAIENGDHVARSSDTDNTGSIEDWTHIDNTGARQTKQIYFDNAGGTQSLGAVSTAIKSYLDKTNVQLGASYPVSRLSSKAYDEGMAAGAKFINAHPDEIVIGPSTTQLFANLAQIFDFPAGSELIISEIDHEANISPWVRLAKARDYTIKWWRPTALRHHTPPTSGTQSISALRSLLEDESYDESAVYTLTPSSLQPLLSSRTALVVCSHTSNILGGINPIADLATLTHSQSPHALICVDGVAFAPHRPVDVQSLGVDFYAFSWYKVYGPHIAQLYAGMRTPRVRDALRNGHLGHYFHQASPSSSSSADGASLSAKMALAGASYELVSAIPAVVSYLTTSPTFWSHIATHEEILQHKILSYLLDNDKFKSQISILGSCSSSQATRVPVISFVVGGLSSRAIVEAIEQRRPEMGVRWGHFYSKRLVDDVLGLRYCDGVVRVSLVHYNTEQEVDVFLEALEGVLDEKLGARAGN